MTVMAPKSCGESHEEMQASQNHQLQEEAVGDIDEWARLRKCRGPNRAVVMPQDVWAASQEVAVPREDAGASTWSGYGFRSVAWE